LTEQVHVQFFTELQSQKHSTVTIQSQCYSKSESAITHCCHSTVVSV